MSLNSPHIHFSKGEKIHTYWMVNFSTSCTGKYENPNGNDGKAFTCPDRPQNTFHLSDDKKNGNATILFILCQFLKEYKASEETPLLK